MKRILLLLALVLGFAISAQAQSTTVSGTVTEAGGQTWNNGTINFIFVPPANNNFTPVWTGGALTTPIAGTLNGSGAYSVSVPTNSAISPSGSKWTLQVCTATTPSICYTSAQTITGSTQTINLAPPTISIPPGANNTVYTTTEVGVANKGALIYVLGTGLETCSASTLGICSSWASSGGGGTVTGGPFASGNVVTGGGSQAIQDSGTALSALLTSATAASTYAPIASPTFTGTVTIPTGAVLNTPASIALTNATALPITACAACAPLASPTFTGTVSGITATMVGLGSVTNDIQTKAAIVPNTAPAAGGLLVGNAGGTAYGLAALSGDCTIASTGAITCLKSNNLTISTTYAPLASPTFTGTVTLPSATSFASPIFTGSSNAGLYKGYAVDSGAANAYVITLGDASYTGTVAGAYFFAKLVNASTATSTIAINGGTARTIKVSGGGNANTSSVQANTWYLCFDDGANININPVGGNSQTLSVGAPNLQFYDTATASKQFHFSAASITAANTRTYTMPDASGTMPLLGLAQTFSALQSFTSGVNSNTYATATNCAAVGTAASPSVVSCTAAAAGAFSCATNASGATCTVNTTAVTANSEIFVTQVVDEGTRLSVTCNTASVLPAGPLVATKTGGTGFTINLGTVTTNPGCFDYYIVN